MRRHAGLNPDAHKREPITVDDVLSSRNDNVSSSLARLWLLFRMEQPHSSSPLRTGRLTAGNCRCVFSDKATAFRMPILVTTITSPLQGAVDFWS